MYRKELELNTNKTKIMTFRRGERKISKKDWRWKGRG